MQSEYRSDQRGQSHKYLPFVLPHTGHGWIDLVVRSDGLEVIIICGGATRRKGLPKIVHKLQEIGVAWIYWTVTERYEGSLY